MGSAQICSEKGNLADFCFLPGVCSRHGDKRLTDREHIVCLFVFLTDNYQGFCIVHNTQL